jgi:hypothetical protein
LYAAESITVTNVASPFSVPPNTAFQVTVTVQYSFDISTRVEVDIYDYSTSSYISSASTVDALQGTGQKTYSFSLTSPQTQTIWSLSAVALYGPNNAHVTDNWDRNFDVVVENQSTTTSVSTSIYTTTSTSTAVIIDYPMTVSYSAVAFILGIVIAFIIAKRTRPRDETRVF